MLKQVLYYCIIGLSIRYSIYNFMLWFRPKNVIMNFLLKLSPYRLGSPLEIPFHQCLYHLRQCHHLRPSQSAQILWKAKRFFYKKFLFLFLVKFFSKIHLTKLRKTWDHHHQRSRVSQHQQKLSGLRCWK